MTFPQLELPPPQHARVRTALVTEATVASRRRFVVPVAAAAAVMLIAGGGVVAADQWSGGSGGSGRSGRSRLVIPSTKLDRAEGRCNDTRAGARTDAQGLTYVLDRPPGWTAKASVDLVRYCAQPRPVVSYHHPSGRLFALYRGFSTRTAAMGGAVPAKVAARNRSPLGPAEYGARVPVPYRTVDVGGVEGRLIRRDTVAWPVDGQWWTLTGDGVSAGLLPGIAAGLRFDGDRVTWPEAKADGYQPSAAEPRLADLAEGSWQPEWNLCLKQRPGPCSIAFRAARWHWWSPAGQLPPGQATIMKRFTDSRGGGWTTPRGVVQSFWYGPDTATYRKAAGSQHLIPLGSPEVTRLLSREGLA